MRLRITLIATLMAAAVTLTACGGGSSDATEATSSGKESDGAATEVKIADFAFDPEETEVKVGDTVTFTNSDSAAHTATADKDAPKAFDTKKISGDESAEVTFDEAGDYSYSCSIHDYMKGTIRVMK